MHLERRASQRVVTQLIRVEGYVADVTVSKVGPVCERVSSTEA